MDEFFVGSVQHDGDGGVLELHGGREVVFRSVQDYLFDYLGY